MTARITRTEELTSTPTDSGEAATSTRDTLRPAHPRRSSGWVVWVGIAAALAAASALVIVGVIGGEPTSDLRVEQATTARLQGLADQYEAVRSTRANEATTARLQGLADQYEAVRSARANQAATARLQGLADRYYPTP